MTINHFFYFLENLIIISWLLFQVIGLVRQRPGLGEEVVGFRCELTQPLQVLGEAGLLAELLRAGEMVDALVGVEPLNCFLGDVGVDPK